MHVSVYTSAGEPCGKEGGSEKLEKIPETQCKHE